MIAPTVARSLHYYPHPKESYGEGPLAAILAAVNDDGTINLGVFDKTGGIFGRTNVQLVQPGETPAGDRGFAAWMPYQTGQAQKTAELEKQLADNSTLAPAATTEPPAPIAPQGETGQGPAPVASDALGNTSFAAAADTKAPA